MVECFSLGGQGCVMDRVLAHYSFYRSSVERNRSRNLESCIFMFAYMNAFFLEF